MHLHAVLLIILHYQISLSYINPNTVLIRTWKTCDLDEIWTRICWLVPNLVQVVICFSCAYQNHVRINILYLFSDDGFGIKIIISLPDLKHAWFYEDTVLYCHITFVWLLTLNFRVSHVHFSAFGKNVLLFMRQITFWRSMCVQIYFTINLPSTI